MIKIWKILYESVWVCYVIVCVHVLVYEQAYILQKSGYNSMELFNFVVSLEFHDCFCFMFSEEQKRNTHTLNNVPKINYNLYAYIEWYITKTIFYSCIASDIRIGFIML